MKRTVLLPLPDRDFDVTEVAVPWKLLTATGHRVVFATEAGAEPAADPLLIRGVLFGQLGAARESLAFYRELERDPSFCKPRLWSQTAPEDYDALFLPGGHAPGMRQYLESESLRANIARFFAIGRPVAAICHGVLAAARAVDPMTGRSVLYGRRSTCLPKYMERTAYYLTAWKLGRYFRTYPTYVEDEVKACLAETKHFERGPFTILARGTNDDDHSAFVVRDGLYLSARWPGDAYLIAKELVHLLEHDPPAASQSATASGVT